MTSKIPEAPKRTKAGGRRLWRDVVTKYELEEDELALLREAVRTVDLLDDLAAAAEEEGLIVGGPTAARCTRR
jgi:hypothetical protein